MKATKPYMIGGVMRCCIATLLAADVEEKEGEILKCKYCDHGFIMKDDVWEKWWGPDQERHDKEEKERNERKNN